MRQPPYLLLFALLLINPSFLTRAANCIGALLEMRPHFRTVSGYILTQQNERLHFEGGLRWDYFRFNVRNGVNETPAIKEAFAGVESGARFQPKVPPRTMSRIA